jgi:hypothetical protein
MTRDLSPCGSRLHDPKQLSRLKTHPAQELPDQVEPDSAGSANVMHCLFAACAMPRKKSRYRLRLISGELGDEVWSRLAAYEGLTPKDGYVEWQMDDYSEMGNEVFDYLGPKGMFVLGWTEDPEDEAPPGDLCSQSRIPSRTVGISRRVREQD